MKMANLEGKQQTKLCTFLRNFEVSTAFKRFLGFIHGYAMLLHKI